MTADAVFICHASPDAEFAHALSIALETCGLHVWRDSRQLRGGERLNSEVRWAIEHARQVIVVLSLQTGKAPWMRREIELAQEVERRRANSYRVIPVLLPGVTEELFGAWFIPQPPTPPLTLTMDGLGAALPALLTALDAPAPSETTERDIYQLAELEITFSPADPASGERWRMTARLHQPADRETRPDVDLALTAPPPPLAPERLRWYLTDALRWPSYTVQKIAERTATTFTDWGRIWYQATLGSAPLAPLTAEWRTAPEPGEHRLTLRAHTAAASLLDLPWEWLHDATDFLVQSRQPIQIQRRLAGGGESFPPAPPPLRLLTLGPHPDTEPTDRVDYRRGALSLLDGLSGLGALVDTQMLASPTLAMLKQQLAEACSSGRPFRSVHLDGCFLSDPADPETLFFGLESSEESPARLWREAHFVPVATLAALLITHGVHLVVLTRPEEASGSVRAFALASILLEAGLAGVILVHPAAPAPTLSRFWAIFYEELLRGARLSQALFAAQHRLVTDSYRGPGLGGGGVYLRDWLTCVLYLGQHDPRFVLRPPLALWRRLCGEPRPALPSAMPRLPPTGCLGRGRELLILERLLTQQASVFIKGVGGSGKTTLAVELASWFLRINRYRQIAYVHADDAINPHALLEVLGQQLLPASEPWAVDQYPSLWQALDALRQALWPRPILIVLDQTERWSVEHDNDFQRFWRALADHWPALHLVALGRLGPPPFAQPWAEMKLAALDEIEAISLIAQALIAAGEGPPPADSGTGFQPVRELARLAGSHPRALRAVAREVGAQGVHGALTLIRPLQAEVLRRHSKDPQWPLYLALELNLRRLPPVDRQQLSVLAFFKEGVNRFALEQALQLTALATDALYERLIALDLVEDRGYGHLRFDPALSRYLSSQLEPHQRAPWQERWRTGMEQLLAHLYQQQFKDPVRVKRLLRLELPNFLALLRGNQPQAPAEQRARISGQLEQLLAGLGIATALSEAAVTRERAGNALLGWTRDRFETERLRIERLRDDGLLDKALQAARQVLQQSLTEGADAYPGAAYDQARAHFQLGKLLKMVGELEPAAREFNTAHQRFQALADAGNAHAARIAAIASAEAGDCLGDLQRLQDAAAAYEAALANASTVISPAVAAHQLQLGLVRQRQGQYAVATTHYQAARKTFTALGDAEGVARSWRQLGLAHRLAGQFDLALEASRQALYLCEQQRNRIDTAEVLDEIGHLHQIQEQLEESVLAYGRMANLYRELGDGPGEQASRNKLANVLIQLHRHDEARQELYRASECNPPESPTARQWVIRRGLSDISQAVEDSVVAEQARRQAIQKYLAYRRAGGKNTNPGAQLCTQTSQAIRTGETTPLRAKLAQIHLSPNIPAEGKLLITKLQAILAGARDPVLAADPQLHYQHAAEIQLLLDELTAS